MLLYLVRHAEAAPGNPDELRPLTEAGKRAARELGSRIAAAGALDAVVTSPLLRACETGVETPAVAVELAPGATAEALVSAVAGRGQRVAAVGHMPDLTVIVRALTGAEIAFAPGDVHEIELAV